MLLTHHHKDYLPLPDEESLAGPMRRAQLTPGNYIYSCLTDPKQMASPQAREQYQQGPVVLVTVFPNGPPAMAKYLLQWFLFCVFVSILVAYLTGRAMAPGAGYLAVFRIAATAAFMGYVASYAIESIWKGWSWSSTLRSAADGVVYALLTAGIFGWL